jgi:hypothetical protein
MVVPDVLSSLDAQVQALVPGLVHIAVAEPEDDPKRDEDEITEFGI